MGEYQLKRKHNLSQNVLGSFDRSTVRSSDRPSSRIVGEYQLKFLAKTLGLYHVPKLRKRNFKKKFIFFFQFFPIDRSIGHGKIVGEYQKKFLAKTLGLYHVPKLRKRNFKKKFIFFFNFFQSTGRSDTVRSWGNTKKSFWPKPQVSITSQS